jgi:hypothetical protein
MLAAMAIEEGHPVHYTAVERGTPVYSSDEVEIGKVDAVVDNYREHILDGFVIELSNGDLRFVDAPEVARTAERAVTLTIGASRVGELPAPEKGAPQYRPRRGGRLTRMFGGGWRRG